MPPRFHPTAASPLYAALVAFVLTALCAGAIIASLERREDAQERTQVADLASDHARALQRSIELALSANNALAALVRQGNGNVPDFEAIGTQMLPFYPGIAALGLAPQGVVQHVVPLRGNESLIGFSALLSPQQSAESALARDSRRMTLAGPLQLVQGGLGVVGRQPVYLDTGSGEERFWGFTSVTIRISEVLSAANLPQLSARGYQYRLWRTVLHTGEEQEISASVPPPGPHAAVRTLSLPNGQWLLAVEPSQGWGSPVKLAVRCALGLLVSLLMAYLARLLLQLKAHEKDLESMVAKRTREIEATQQQLKATIEAIPDLLFELDSEGRFINIHHQRPDMLVAPAASMLGNSIYQHLPTAAAQSFAAALREADEATWSTGHELMLDLPMRGATWFELSVSRKATTPGGGAPGYVVLSRDITERKIAQKALVLTSQAFDQSSEAIVLCDAQGSAVRVNRAFSRITGFSAAEALGRPVSLFTANADATTSFDQLCEQLNPQGFWEGEVCSRRKDGSIYPQWLSLSNVRDEQDRVTHHIALFRDTTQQRETQDRIRHLAHFDHLTGLPNRALLAERAQRDIEQERRNGGSLAMVFIDLDHFKNVNDSLGHRIGDTLLVAMSKRLQALVRAQDTVSRLGGDEFLLLLPGTTAEAAALMATDLLHALAQPFQIDQYELTTTLSIGIAVFPTDGGNFDTLYQRADAAMYRAKRSGRNRHSFFTADLEARSARTLALENALHRALERQQFELHYQPQVSLHTRQIVGAEALLRWRHPELGMVSPAEFIPVAENSGMIVAIGEWVLRTAARDAKHWLDQQLPLRTVSVNLSAIQFRHPQLPDMVSRCLHEANLCASHLELELTEGAAVDDPDAALTVMQQLHERGARLSMDDFGTGYSSLNQLKRFPLGKLKIDQSFVRDVSVDASDRAIISAIIRMAQAMDMTTTAEGVETEEQLAFLLEQGCDEGQGYLFSRPVPALAFEALLRAKNA